MSRSRTGDWPVVMGPGPTVHFFYTFSFSSLVMPMVIANLRRCLHYHIRKRFTYALLPVTSLIAGHTSRVTSYLLYSIRNDSRYVNSDHRCSIR